MPVALDRRGFLRTGVWGAATGLALASPSIARPPARVPAPRRDPRKAMNVIFMVADGMSTGTLTLADEVTRLRQGRSSHWVSLWNQPDVKRASATTNSADSLVTDSSAGASAWSIGKKVNNDVMSITPDGAMPTPILVHARQNGKATGLVTTARVTHATPGAFVANVPNRDLENDIAEQIIARGVDVALGGGSKYFPQKLLDGARDVRVVRSAAELAPAVAEAGGVMRLLGIFDPSHVPWVLDRPATCPSLPEMTRAALTMLKGKPNGFVMQIEGGRVDHAAHGNDAASLIAEQVEFDETIAVVREFTRDRDDTLVIVTSDHGNANPGLTLYGKPAQLGLEVAAGAKHSFDWIFDSLCMGAGMKAGGDPAKVSDLTPLRDLVHQALGVELSDHEFSTLEHAIRKQETHPFLAQAAKYTSVLGAILSNHNAIGFVSPNHTSDMVEVTAWGLGSEPLKPFIDNTDLHAMVVGALDLAPAKAI
jgi:alkaline phosphatase